MTKFQCDVSGIEFETQDKYQKILEFLKDLRCEQAANGISCYNYDCQQINELLEEIGEK